MKSEFKVECQDADDEEEEEKKLTFRSINWIQQEWPLIGSHFGVHYQLLALIEIQHIFGSDRWWISREWLKKLKRFNKKKVAVSLLLLIPQSSIQFSVPRHDCGRERWDNPVSWTERLLNGLFSLLNSLEDFVCTEIF